MSAGAKGRTEEIKFSKEPRQGWPTGEHCVPVRTAVCWTKTDEHNFPENNERRDLGTGGDKSCARNRRALISIRRPEMKWRGRNFEREPNQRHDDPDGEERLKRN